MDDDEEPRRDRHGDAMDDRYHDTYDAFLGIVIPPDEVKQRWQAILAAAAAAYLCPDDDPACRHGRSRPCRRPSYRQRSPETGW